jgi:hypothetical protein
MHAQIGVRDLSECAVPEGRIPSRSQLSQSRILKPRLLNGHELTRSPTHSLAHSRWLAAINVSHRYV